MACVVSRCTPALMWLPQEILARIFSLLPFDERLSKVPVVCKGWNQIARDHGAVIWQSCEVENSAFPSQTHPPYDYLKVVQWFGEHGRFVKSLSMSHPARTEEAEEQGWRRFRNGLAAILAHTPHLEVLDCHDLGPFLIPEEGLCILKRFSSLRLLSLDMRSIGNWQEATLQPLSHLTRLDDLNVVVSGLTSEPLLLAQGLSKLVGLTSLTLNRRISTFADFPAAINAVAMPNLAGVVASLTCLDTLDLSGVINSIPDSFSCLKMLTDLRVGNFHKQGPAFSISPAFAACSPIQTLSLTNLSSASAQSLPETCSTIHRLQSLRHLLIHADLSDVDAAACSFSPHLTELELACDMSMLPPCILSMTGLQSLLFLTADGGSCSVPPIGPYLQNLTSLRLWATPRDVSIPFLLAAGSLEHLSLSSAEHDFPSADIDRVLDHRPAACFVEVNDQCWPSPDSCCPQEG